jgi:diguanylate cyclase (GGDEF)-like protein
MSDQPSSHPEATPYGARPSAGDAEPNRPRRKVFPLSIRLSLLIVILIPIAVAVGLGTRVVTNQTSRRDQALTVRHSSLVLDTVLQARIDIYSEYVPTAAIVAGRAHNLTGVQLDKLLGVNFTANLAHAERAVDRQAEFQPNGLFASEHAQLLALRQTVTNGTATPNSIEAFFNNLSSKIDAEWIRTLNTLHASQSADSRATDQRMAALDSAFDAFSSGLDEESLQVGGSLETVLVVGPTPPSIQSLIVAQERFISSTHSFPQALGPKATAAWTELSRNPLSRKFTAYAQLGISIGLNHEVAPYATNSAAISEIGKSEVEWANALTHLVLASSADLRVATDNQANSATTALAFSSLFLVFLVLASIVGVLCLARAVRRPIAEIVTAFESVREGEFDLPRLDESGPREIALAAGAFNEMTSTLHAVQAQAIALSEGDLDAPALQHPLPGRTGKALQSALNKLHISIRANEMQREELFERATRDSLTGLLNRGAALEALNIDLAAVRRSQGALVLTVLFIDLDELKKTNDSLGHEAGDAAIRAVANALKATTRASDVVSRYGGDEFVVGWLGREDAGATALLAKRISELVAASEVQNNGHHATLGCSIGVAISGSLDTTVLTVIERADHALYEAKKYGRGQVRWFETETVETV